MQILNLSDFAAHTTSKKVIDPVTDEQRHKLDEYLGRYALG